MASLTYRTDFRLREYAWLGRWREASDVARLAGYDAMAARCLTSLVLTVVRSGEILGATTQTTVSCARQP